MPNELGIKVKVNLDTSEQALRDQMKGVQSYFDKDPVKIAFAPDKTKTRSNINQVLRDMTSGKEGVQITVPEITLKFKVNGKEVGTQIKAALQEAADSAFSGSSRGGKDITSNLKKQLDGIVKEYSNTQKKISSLSKAQIGVDQNSDYYIELQRQIDKAKESYASLRAEFAKSFPNSIEELAKQEAKLNEELKDKQALDALRQQYNQLNANASVYDSTSVKIERLTAQIDYQRKVLEEYKNVGIDTSYANVLVEGFDKFNTGESGKALDDATKLRALQDAATSLNSEMARLAKQYSDVTTKQQNVAKSAQNLAGELTRILQDNPRIRESTELYNNFVEVIDRLNHVDVKDQQGFAKLQVRAASLKSEFIQLGLNTDTLYTKLSRLFTEHFQTALVMAGIHGIQQGLQEVIVNVSNLDRSMTELRKVTDETENTYNQFLDGAAEKARELGTSIADYVDTTANLAQAGFPFEDADQLSYISTLYKNVGDGIESAAEASEYLISTMNGFGLAADSAMHLTDAINSVSNTQAVSMKDIGEFLTRSSAALSVAGASAEEAIALGTAINSVTRNAAQTGTVLKTMSMYLRASKTDLEEAGESADGCANSVSELRDEILAITNNQVDIMEANGTTYKGPFEIYKEIAEVWDQLADVDQANLTELLGGKRNANAVVALIENFDIAEQSLETALDSTGSAVQENERYLDSIAGKTAQLQAAFEQLSNTLLDSDVIKFFLDLGIGATDAANALAELTGVLPILATGLSSVGLLKGGMAGGLSAFATLGNDFKNMKDAASQMAAVSESGRVLASVFQGFTNNKIILNSAAGVTEFTNSLKGLNEQQQIAALSFVKFDGGSKQATQALIEQASATLGLSTATVGATTAQQALNVALGIGKTLLAGLGIGLVVAGIQALVGVVNDFIHAQERANEAMENSANALQQTQSNYDSIKTKIEEVSKSIDELNSKDVLSITDKEELENLEKENQLLEAQLALEKQKLEVNQKQAEKDTIKAANKYGGSTGSLGVSRDDVANANLSSTDFIASTNGTGSSLTNLLASYQKLVQLQKTATNPNDVVKYNEQIDNVKASIMEQVGELQNYQDTLNEIGYDNLSEEGKAVFDDIQESIETVLSYLDKTYYFNILINKDEFEKERQEIINYAQSMGGDTMDVAVDLLNTKNWSDETNEFIKQMQEAGMTAYDIAQSIVGDFGSISDAISSTSPELTAMNKKLDETQAAYQTVRAAIDEYNEYGLLSADTLQQLNTLHPQYKQCLLDENGQLNINQNTLARTKESYAQMASSIYEVIAALKIKNTIESIENLNNASIAELNYEVVKSNDDLVASYSGAEYSAENLGETLKKKLNDRLHELAASGEVGRAGLEKAQAAMLQEIDTTVAYMSAMDQASKSVFENTDAQLNYVSRIRDTGKAQDEQNNKIHDAIGAFADLYAAMKEYNTYGEISYSTLQGLLEAYPELTSCLVEEGDKLTINTTALRNYIEQQLASTVAQEDATNTADEYSRMLEWINENAMSDTLTLAQLQDMIKGVGTAMEESRSAVQGYDSALTSVMQELLSYDPTEGTFYDQDHINRIYEMESALAGFGDVLSYDSDTKQVQLDYEALKKRTLEAIDDEIERAQAAGDKVTEAMLSASYTAIKKGDKEAIDYWIETGEVLDAVSISLDEFQTNYNDLIDITEEYNQNGELSQDSWQKLMAMGPQFVACLEMEGDQLVFNKDRYVDLYKAQLQFMIGVLEAVGADEKLIKSLKDLVDGMEDADIHFGRSTDALEKYKEALSKIGDVFDSVLNLINKGLDATQDALQDAADNLQIIGDAIIDEIDDRIDALEEQKDALEDFYDEQIGNLEDLKDAQDDANEEVERAIELAKLQDALAKAKANRTVRKYVEGQGYIWTVDEDAVRDAEQALSDQQREWAQQDAQDAIDDQIDKIEQDQEAATDAIDDQIAKLEELKDKYSEVMDLIGMDWDEYQVMLEAQAAANGMTLDEMEANLDDYKNAVVDNMKEVDKVTDTQEQIEGLQNFIDTLKEVWTVVSTIIDVIKLLTGGDGLLGALQEFVENLFGGGEDGDEESEVGEEGGNVFDSLLDSAKGFFKNLKKKFDDGFDDISEKVGDFGRNTWQKIQGFFTDTGTNVQGFLNNIKKFFTGGWENISSGVHSFIENVKGIFNGGLPNISSLTDNFIQTITGFFSNGFPNLSNIVSNFFTNLPSIFSGGLENILSTVTSWFPSLSGLFSNGLNSLITTVSGFVGNLGSIGTTLLSSLGGAAPVVAAGAAAVGAGIIINKGASSIHDYAEDKINQAIENEDLLGSIGWGAVSGVTGAISDPIGTIVDGVKKLFGFAKGTKFVPKSSLYNVDELGTELLVRKPVQGRYTYLETGDGVVPADMTKNIFSMAKNPDDWFRKQLGKFGTVTNANSSSSSMNISMGNIIINQPVGNTDQLARAIKQELPNKFKQELNKR